MSRNLSALATLAAVAAVATAAVALIVAPNTANAAGDITDDPVPFVSSASRAQVRTQLLDVAKVRGDAEEAYAPPASRAESALQRVDVRDEYKAARDEVSATTREDSGSTYFKAHPVAANPTAIMGAPGQAR